MDKAALRQQAASARGFRATRRYSNGSRMEGPDDLAAAHASQFEDARIQGNLPVPSRSRGETIQAVHQDFSQAVSDRAGMSRLSWHEAQARSVERSSRRQDRRRSRG